MADCGARQREKIQGGRGEGGGPGANLMFRHTGHWLLVNESFIPLRLSSPADTLWLRPSFAAYCLPDNMRSIKSSARTSQVPQECHRSLKKNKKQKTEESVGALWETGCWRCLKIGIIYRLLRAQCAANADGLKLPFCLEPTSVTQIFSPQLKHFFFVELQEVA